MRLRGRDFCLWHWGGPLVCLRRVYRRVWIGQKGAWPQVSGLEPEATLLVDTDWIEGSVAWGLPETKGRVCLRRWGGWPRSPMQLWARQRLQFV